MRYRVHNQTRNTLLGSEIERADRFFSRLVGLLGKSHLPLGHGLLIEPCTSIHTFFMRFSIDVVFLDAECQVIDVAHALGPWRVSRFYPSSRQVLELPAGAAEASLTGVGDRLVITPENRL